MGRTWKSPTRHSLALAFLATTACGSGSAPEGNTPLDVPPLPPASLTGTEWVLESIEGEAPIVGSRVTLEFTADGMGGYSGCNWYGGPFERRGDVLRAERMMSTGRACLRPEGIMDQEERYLSALADLTSYRITADTLVLQEQGGRALSFTARTPLAMDPADLVGTAWRLDTWNREQREGDSSITFTFGDDMITGYAGCRDFTAVYRAQGDRIGFPEISMLAMECQIERMRVREGDFTTMLSESAHYRLSAGLLDLYTVGGDTLVFRSDRR